MMIIEPRSSQLLVEQLVDSSGDRMTAYQLLLLLLFLLTLQNTMVMASRHLLSLS